MPCLSMGSETPVLPVNALSIKLDGITRFISPMLSESHKCSSRKFSSNCGWRAMSYNAICTSRIILEGIVFQEPYKRVAPARRPCEHKTLEFNKSLSWKAL